MKNFTDFTAELDEAIGKRPVRADRFHIVNKNGKPAALASYADKESAMKDRNEKHQGAEVHQMGARGKVKKVFEAELDEAAQGHTIEAHGIRGMKGTAWRKTFKNHEHLEKWADANDSIEVHAVRDLEGVKKKTNEDTELDEAVSVEHDRYVRSHGKKASGSGTWMFTHKRAGAVDYKNEKHVHQATGSFSDAKKSAKEWGKSHGHSTVYVMEETMTEGAEADKHYDESEQHKNKASKALETSDMEGYHHHMSNHHEAKSRWHETQGRYSSADREAAKAEEHHEKGVHATGIPSRTVKSESHTQQGNHTMLSFTEFIDETSMINGKDTTNQPTWKMTSLKHDDAVKLHGKDNVRKTPSLNRSGQPTGGHHVEIKD